MPAVRDGRAIGPAAYWCWRMTGYANARSGSLEAVPDPLAHLVVDLEVPGVVLEPVAQVVEDREVAEFVQAGRRAQGAAASPGRSLERRFELVAQRGRGARRTRGRP